MRTAIKLGKDEETINLLYGFVPGFTRDRAMNAFGLKFKNETDFNKYASELQDAIVKAEAEQRKLKDLQCRYNKTFPSDNNKCLTTPHLLYNAIRSTIIEIRESIKKFCPKTRKAPGTYSSNTYTFSNSYLCNQTPYIPDMYPEIYPEYVKNVLELLEKYIAVATGNILICKDMIDEEKDIRNNDEYLEQIDLECQKVCREIAITARDGGFLTKEITKDDYEKTVAEARSIKEYRRKQYHNISTKQYQQRVFRHVIMEGINNGLTSEESRIWTNPEVFDFVKEKVRPAINAMIKRKDLPLLKVKNSTDKQIKADYIACFMIWCRVGKSHYREFVEYFRERFADTHFRFPQYTSITAAANRINDKTKEKYMADFEPY